MAAKKFPLGKLRELHKHVAAMHAHLSNLIADCDGTARDDSDKGTTWAPGQDASLVDVVRAAIRAEADAPKPMDYLFNRK